MEEPRRTVEMTDWEAVTAELERFCADGTFHTESEELYYTFRRP